MSDEQPPEYDDSASLAEIAALDAYLDTLGRTNPLEGSDVPVDAALRIAAAQLRMAQDGVEEPDPAFIELLHQQIRDVQRRRERIRVSRMRFLRGAGLVAAAAGLVGIGFEIDEEQRRLRQPTNLVTGSGRWYDIAAADEVARGQMKAFTAGGILGYLVNDGGTLRALSAICTHMGCRLKPDGGESGLRCLCHGSRFSADGRVVAGIAPDPLPHIALRMEDGRVYAYGTQEDIST